MDVAVAVGVAVAAAVVAAPAEAPGAVVSTSLVPGGEVGVAAAWAAAAVWAVGAEASSLGAVPAAGAAAVAPDRVGYGHRFGAGSTAAGAALHPLQGHLQ